MASLIIRNDFSIFHFLVIEIIKHFGGSLICFKDNYGLLLRLLVVDGDHLVLAYHVVDFENYVLVYLPSDVV